MPARQYVLLRHECPTDYRDGPHWDLMVEDGDALRTWSLLELPTAWGGVSDSVLATPLPPHRKAYLDYEGEVSRGRGRVSRVARGECEIVADEPALATINATSGQLIGIWRIEGDDDIWWLSVD